MNHPELLLSMILRTTIRSLPTIKISNLSATPNQNFTFIGWFDQEGVNISPQISVTRDQNITAKFEKRHYPINQVFPELSPTGGTILVTGHSDQDYLYFGESISFTANQLDHWAFESWSDTSETDLSRSITIDSSTPTIEATFSLSCRT